ncbi:translation initiation factor IF-3 [Anaplasma phagocytophilum]|uniref:Translation initiation factor IF-3 n=10 Tax=Anaplasma phagocytophilum TaxID=948 RepID=A0A098EHX4_ANAPH|nr:translation initiation factor IF-3 [Anaplasma phagocytophilum]KJV64044.1 translation initiation factor IF-3 [Anaplasma phagocytophilum str. ApMUC09]KJV67089.1 translation initiation factor IF-3 [Anaplasma phagocytophilum str. ApNP]KJZ98440.1 translation initiation factor IF-3 [Anaplasma phagocytophilum str. CR1007]ABD43760.1 translation initiation factor IF-3 [Anaplasma phagocytophilum str. HZ]AGR79100.1 translation initiation factor IF-3 [Anaplasma phagocytophilum str. HZ2]
MDKKGPRINDAITTKRVRLVDETGTMVGVVDIEEALAVAARAGMDLVEVVSEGEYPVCKVYNYSKQKYNKKKHGVTKKQRSSAVKELKFRINIEDNDYNIKLNNLKSFIEKGNKVKVSLRFVGRELQYKEVGLDILDRLVSDTEGIAKPESSPRMDGNVLSMMFGAKTGGGS